MAVGIGAIAGLCILVGMAILFCRRTVGPVFSAATRMASSALSLQAGTDSRR